MFDSFVLLSPDTVALPITRGNSIEICNFAKELAALPPPAPAPGETGAGDAASSVPEVPLLDTTCVLELPPLDSDALVLRMTCRCEPNPRGPAGSATHVNTKTSFYSDPEEAIMILHLHIRLPFGAVRVYTMIVHRSSLLKIVHETLDAREQEIAREEGPQPVKEFPPPASFAPLVANFLPQEYVFNAVFAPLPHDNVDDDELDRILPPSVPWKDWGPAHTRWFQDESVGTRWMATTCGQRFVRVRNDGRLYVYDFNRRALRRFLQQRALTGEPVGSRRGEKVVGKDVRELWAWSGRVESGNGSGEALVDEDEDSKLHLKVMLGTTVMGNWSAWAGEMESSLPYIERSVPISDEYESALIDEDIVVGLKVGVSQYRLGRILLIDALGCRWTLMGGILKKLCCISLEDHYIDVIVLRRTLLRVDQRGT